MDGRFAGVGLCAHATRRRRPGAVSASSTSAARSRSALRRDALRRAPQLLAALGDAVRTDLTHQQVLGSVRLTQQREARRLAAASLAGMVQDATLPSGAAVLVGDWPAIGAGVARLLGPPRRGWVR